MPEILARTFLPIVPVQPEEVARKADTGARFALAQPIDRHVGMLWAFPSSDPQIAELHVWTGSEWLPIGGGAVVPPAGDAWDGFVWDDGTLWS